MQILRDTERANIDSRPTSCDYFEQIDTSPCARVFVILARRVPRRYGKL